MDIVEGVHVALITPLDEAGTYQPDVMEHVINRAKGFVQGFSVLGSTGEGPMLPWSTKEILVEHVLRLVGDEYPVSCGIVGLSSSQCIEDCTRVASWGIHGALVLPPYYYPIQPAEVVAFYESVADRSPIPIVLYHIPQFTKVSVSVNAISRLSAHPNIVGLKDSSLDYGFFQRVRLQVPKPFKLFTGSDDLLVASTIAGGSGTICASANVVPEWVSSLWQQLQSGVVEDAWATQKKIITLVDVCRTLGAGRAWKAAVELLGFGEAKPYAPLAALSDEKQATLRMALVEAGVIH